MLPAPLACDNAVETHQIWQWSFRINLGSDSAPTNFSSALKTAIRSFDRSTVQARPRSFRHSLATFEIIPLEGIVRLAAEIE